MDPRDKAVIRKNLQYLMKHLDVDPVRHYLYQKFILTEDDMEVLGKQCTTRGYKIEVLLIHILPRKPPQAYQEFIRALEQDGHYQHILDTLNATHVSMEDLEKAESDGNRAFHKVVDELYERVQSRRMSVGHVGRGTPNCTGVHYPPQPQRMPSNPSSGFDTVDGPAAASSPEPINLPADTFSVRLETSDASERCRFDPDSYLLHLSEKGVALIHLSEYLQCNSVEMCPEKALWGYHVIRQYGSGPDRFVFEVGRRANTGQGMFYFKTTSEEDGERIAATIKRYTNMIRSRQNVA